MSEPIDTEKKKVAAILYALGWARGILSDVLDGDFSREKVQRILNATAASRIAQSIGLSEFDLVDDGWIDLLTGAEKDSLQGYEEA